MRTGMAVFLAGALMLAGCEDKKPKSDLAQEMGAQKMIYEIDNLTSQGDYDGARAILKDLQARFGHTQTFINQKRRLENIGVSNDSPDQSLTAARLIELENIVLAFRAENGRWPDPGEVKRPLDAWNNETYWMEGGLQNSYDLLLMSAGADGQPGSGDELMIVYVDDHEGATRRNVANDANLGAAAQSRARSGGESGGSRLMSVEQLRALEGGKAHAEEKTVTLDELKAAAQPSGQAGDEKVVTLDELKDQ